MPIDFGGSLDHLEVAAASEPRLVGSYSQKRLSDPQSELQYTFLLEIDWAYQWQGEALQSHPLAEVVVVGGTDRGHLNQFEKR